MRGVFFVQLQDYVSKKFDSMTWNKIIAKAGVPSKVYFSYQQYSEEEFYRVMAETIHLTQMPRNEILEEIGENLTPFFFQTFNSVIQKEWRTLDLVERIEHFNYKILQQGDDEGEVGKFTCQRVKPHLVEIKYNSPRKMCSLLIGLVKGFSKHFKEKITINHTQCIFDGAPECHFSVLLQK